MEIQTKLNWKSFEPKLGTWASKIKPFFDSGGFDKIYEFLKLKKTERTEIAPSSFCLFRAFKMTNLNELKCVIIGENPYNSFVDGSPIDTGVLFGASTKIQPNLKEFYNGIENELYNGLNLDILYDYELDYLTSQGVLMIPSSLTIEKDAEKGHNKIWKSFIEYLLKEIIAYTGVPILFLGRSKQYMPLMEQSNYCYSLELPSFGNIWDTKGIFKEINSWIWASNEETIMWLNVDVPF